MCVCVRARGTQWNQHLTTLAGSAVALACLGAGKVGGEVYENDGILGVSTQERGRHAVRRVKEGS